MEPHSFENTGALPRTKDERDYVLALGSASIRPSTYLPDEFFARTPVYYQRQIPDCGANAGAFIAGYLDDTHAEYSPDYQWIDIKTFDGYPLDAGTDMRSIFKSLTKGSVPYTLLPEQTTLDLTAFSSTSRLTPAIITEAPQHTIQAYGFHTEALTFDDLKQLIWANKAVVLLIRIGDEFWTDKNGTSSWQEKDILPLRSPKKVVSGHFIVAGGYDDQYIYFANWWSDSWGRKGYGYFGENYLPQITEVGTIVDSVTKVSIPAYTWTRDLYFGISGTDVQELQKYLNSKGFTVASNGAGSPGNETTYYGTLTKNAVMRFQAAHNITPIAGYFGPKTRAYIAQNP